MKKNNKLIRLHPSVTDQAKQSAGSSSSFSHLDLGRLPKMSTHDHAECLQRFFRIILEPRKDLEQLVLPIKFMDEYGDELRDVVTLKVPTGKTWIIELLKEKGKAWLKDGWDEFVKYYSISPGYFLIFAYGGLSKFNVFIFDMTTCEIEYPFDPRDNEEQDVTAATQMNNITPTTNCSSSKGNGIIALVSQFKQKYENITIQHMKEINSGEFDKPSFAVIMNPTQVAYDFRCNVPRKFATEYLTGKINKNEICTVTNATGETWNIQCEVKAAYVRFSTGWRNYAIDNNLRVGDICVFEMVDAARRLFNVQIIRLATTSATSDIPGTSYNAKGQD